MENLCASSDFLSYLLAQSAAGRLSRGGTVRSGLGPPTDTAIGQSDGGNSSADIPSFQCEMLRAMINQSQGD